MANIISVSTYVSIAQNYSHAVMSLVSPATFLDDATQTIVDLHDVLPTVDLVTAFYAAQTGSTTVVASTATYGFTPTAGKINVPTFPTSWIAACRAINSHVISRATYSSVDLFLASATAENTVPPQWVQLCNAAGFTGISHIDTDSMWNG